MQGYSRLYNGYGGINMRQYETFNGYEIPVRRLSDEEIEDNIDKLMALLDSIDEEAYNELEEYFND